MKKEEQIKQLKTQLAKLQPLVELSKLLPKSHLANFVSDELAKEIKELTDALEQLEKIEEEKQSEGSKKFMSAMRSAIYSPILNFNGVEITSYLDSFGKITDFRDAIPVKSLYKDFPTTQFLGYNSNSEKYIFCSNRNGQLHEGMPTNMLYFGSKEEKQLKHPHMKDIVATFCISADGEFEVEKLTDADKINWEEWDKVQIIGEDREYGIVVKATIREDVPNQFSLFFCEKE